MSNIILNLAMSLDGYIIDKNRKYDWIVGDGDKSLDTETQFDFSKFLNSIDTIVMGRNSYEEIGLKGFEGKKIVVATSQNYENTQDVTFVSDNIVDYVDNLRKETKGDIWLFGGSILTDAFIKADIIDRYIVATVPTILGDGHRLFFDGNPKIDLQLDRYYLGEGLIIMDYSKRK